MAAPFAVGVARGHESTRLEAPTGGAVMSPPELRIDEACDRFEAEWRAGRRPSMEVDLDGFPEPERAELFRELLRLEIELRREGGEEPMRDEYERRFPEYIGPITAAFHEGETDPSRSSTRVSGRE